MTYRMCPNCKTKRPGSEPELIRSDEDQCRHVVTMRVKLPPRFYFDHVSRDLPAGTVVKETKRYVEVEVTASEHAELLSDAEHYAYSMAEAGFDGFGLIASARATVRALNRQPFAVEWRCHGIDVARTITSSRLAVARERS